MTSLKEILDNVNSYREGAEWEVGDSETVILGDCVLSIEMEEENGLKALKVHINANEPIYMKDVSLGFFEDEE